MSAISTQLTADDLLNLPPDNMRHELIRGELTTRPPTNGEHGVSTLNIAGILRDFLKANPIGVDAGAETGFIISRNPDTVRAPDAAFIHNDRIPPGGVPKKFWPLAPDLAVEILSPSDSYSEVMEKIDEWLTAGTRLVWVIDPAKKTVGVYAPHRQPRILKSADQLDGEQVLPGFKLAVAEIFR